MVAISSPQSDLSRPAVPLPRFKVLILCSHVVPYASPLFRHVAQDPRVEILVAYCNLQGAQRSLDPEFGVEVQWDEPLLDGYPWVDLSKQASSSKVSSLFGLWNSALWSLIRGGSFDAVLIYTGYMCAAFWQAVLAANSRGIPVVISSDSTVLQPRDQARWKRPLKPFILGGVYRSVDVLMAGSPAAPQLAARLGMPQERLMVIRSGADKDAGIARAGKADLRAIRASWNVPADAPVVFYCGKLQPWKRPLDLLSAFAKANVVGAYLVFAGDGVLRRELEDETRRLNVQDRVRLLGFVNGSFQRALIIALLSLGMAIFLFPTEVADRFTFYSETISLSGPSSELLQRTGDYPIRNFLYAFDNPRWPYGFGIGTASLGTQYVTRIFHVPLTGFAVESGYASIVVELGIVGLFLWLVMTTAIVVSAWKIVRKLKGTVWFPIGFVIFWYAALLLFPYTYEGLSPYEDFILNSLLWVSLGILFRLPKLAGEVQANPLTAASSPAVRTN